MVISLEAIKATTKVPIVKQAANIYQVSSSKTSVNAGTLSYTLFTMLIVASYLRWDWVAILLLVLKCKFSEIENCKELNLF